MPAHAYLRQKENWWSHYGARRSFVPIGKRQIESVITRRSAEQLGPKKGDKVTVVIKSTEVMLKRN